MGSPMQTSVDGGQQKNGRQVSVPGSETICGGECRHSKWVWRVLRARVGGGRCSKWPGVHQYEANDDGHSE